MGEPRHRDGARDCYTTLTVSKPTRKLRARIQTRATF